MHADEANQAVKAGILWQTGTYHYDLTDHHGPSLYWLTLPALWASGAKTFAQTDECDYRVVPALFGVALVALTALLADGLGAGAVLWAAVLVALSPAMIYYSRYYIQEMLLVTLTFVALACGWRYVRSQRALWALAAGAALGLAHATKETWVFAAAAMLAGVVLTMAWSRWLAGKKGTVPICRNGHDQRRPLLRSGARSVPAAAHKWGRSPFPPRRWVLLAAAAVACAVAAPFYLYSRSGVNWHGPWDSVSAYANYWRRGAVLGLHVHPWYYYLQTLFACRPGRGFFWSEGLIAGLAVVGAARGLGIFDFGFWILDSKSSSAPATGSSGSPESAASAPLSAMQSLNSPIQNPKSPIQNGPSPTLLRFLTFYTFVLIVLYALIPYKTPWCGLSLLHGMTLLAGAGAWSILCWAPGWPGKLIAAAILALGTAQLGWQGYELSFRYPADDRNPYAYAHTSPGVVDLADRLQRLAQRSKEGHDMTIHVLAENYWPLPWYLRHFNANHVGYWCDAAQWLASSPRLPPPAIILFTTDLEGTVDAGLHGAYNKQMLCRLRPGVFLRVYVRQDLWEKMINAKMIKIPMFNVQCAAVARAPH